jgi:hypothetical protein
MLNVVGLCVKLLNLCTLQVPWKQAQEICCSINMQLINIRTEEQLKCFKSLGVSSGKK